MTSLTGKRLVSKTHGRIVFRGLVDSLEAEVIEAQVLAFEREPEGELCARLGEVLDYLRAIMAAEVKERPLPPPCLFGAGPSYSMTLPAEQNVPPEHFVPNYSQGALAARINSLRTKVRELELFAVKVFGPGRDDSSDPDLSDIAPREDIILALNRLSSALWWLFCRHVEAFPKHQFLEKQP